MLITVHIEFEQKVIEKSHFYIALNNNQRPGIDILLKMFRKLWDFICSPHNFNYILSKNIYPFSTDIIMF